MKSSMARRSPYQGTERLGVMASQAEILAPVAIRRKSLGDYDVLEYFAEECAKCMAGEEKLASSPSRCTR
jgi:hypothetical protein